MSKQLRQFYKELDAWIKAGQPPHDIFGQFGLCYTVWKWSRKCKGASGAVADALVSEQSNLFMEAGMDPSYPFNEDGDNGYTEDSRVNGFFNNPLRRAWVEEHANDTDA